MERLFFAVWPGPEAAASLAEVSRSLAELAQGKAVPREKIHLTLAFLGQVAPEERARAVEAASGLRAGVFGMALDHVGSFRSARVAWAGCGRIPRSLERLQSGLDGALRERGFTLEERPFVPHVTLARRIAKSVPRAPMPAIEWDARELTLVRSETGTGRYSVLERWNLG
jgi:RNA 2',3'-cyclic 3'-phosphodiesterase